MELTIELGKRTRRLLERIAVATERIARGIIRVSGGELSFVGLTGGPVFTLENSNPDVPFSISSISATDSEGEPVPLVESFTTTDADVVSIIFAEGSDASNPRAGSIHIGHSGLASLEYTAKDPEGNIAKSGGAQFTTIVGDAASISGGDLAFEGITES